MATLGGVSFRLTGDAELDRKFRELPRRVQKKVQRQALRPAAKLILAEAKKRVTKRSGTAAASLKVRAGKRSRRRPDQVSIVVVTEEGLFKGKAFYFAFGELGHRQGSRKLGDNRRLIPGKHWMRDALRAKESEAKALAMAKIKEAIEREAAGHARSGA